jgi:hypothetical protein
MPWGRCPKYLIRDRDCKYAAHFSIVAVGSGIQELKTPYRMPQANGACERFMGSLRRECMDHMFIQDGKQLQRPQLSAARVHTYREWASPIFAPIHASPDTFGERDSAISPELLKGYETTLMILRSNSFQIAVI